MCLLKTPPRPKKKKYNFRDCKKEGILPTESLAIGHSTTKTHLFFVVALIKLLRVASCFVANLSEAKCGPFCREKRPALAESSLRESLKRRQTYS
mgnify:FL=1